MYTLVLIKNHFIRNLYWDSQMAKRLSVLKPQSFKETFFFHFLVMILKTITNFNKDIFIKESFHGANSYNQVKTKFKIVVTHFELSNPVFFLLVVLFHKKC